MENHFFLAKHNKMQVLINIIRCPVKFKRIIIDCNMRVGVVLGFFFIGSR